MNNKPTRYLILDTNIFQHFGNTSLATSILAVLREAVSLGYGISLSQYSIIELVDGASIQNEGKRLSAIGGLKHFKIRQNTLIAAGHLGSLYKQDGMSDKQQPGKGDKIIGATAIINNCVIYTTNGRHFLPPYFKEIGRHYLPYKKEDGSDVVIMGYFIEPDIQSIVSRYNYYVNAKEGINQVSAAEKTEPSDNKDYLKGSNDSI